MQHKGTGELATIRDTVTSSEVHLGHSSCPSHQAHRGSGNRHETPSQRLSL